MPKRESSITKSRNKRAKGPLEKHAIDTVRLSRTSTNRNIRGSDRCPDKGYAHFKRYVGLGVCAYNLHRIGAELMRQAGEERLKQAV